MHVHGVSAGRRVSRQTLWQTTFKSQQAETVGASQRMTRSRARHMSLNRLVRNALNWPRRSPRRDAMPRRFFTYQVVLPGAASGLVIEQSHDLRDRFVSGMEELGA